MQVRKFRRAGLALVLIAAAPGCEQTVDKAVREKASSFADATEIAAAAGTELCLQASGGEQLLYRFEADQMLDFNLHYHIADEVYYPVPEHQTRAEKGQYTVPADETYCLMWTNPGDTAARLSVTLTGGTDAKWYGD